LKKLFLTQIRGPEKLKKSEKTGKKLSMSLYERTGASNVPVGIASFLKDERGVQPICFSIYNFIFFDN